MLHKGANEVCTLIASHEQLISYVSVKLKGSVLFSFFFLISQMSPKWFHLNNQWFINIFCTHTNSLTALGHTLHAWCLAVPLLPLHAWGTAVTQVSCTRLASSLLQHHSPPCSSPWLRAHCPSQSNSYTGWWYQNCTPCVVILKS